jgi:hypothetical protein
VRLYLITIFIKLKKIHDDVKDDDDFNNGKIYKIYKDINDVLHIGSTLTTLKKYLSKFKKESKARRNCFYETFYNMI